MLKKGWVVVVVLLAMMMDARVVYENVQGLRNVVVFYRQMACEPPLIVA